MRSPTSLRRANSGNALTVRDRIKSLVDDAEPHPKAVILDFNVQEEIDVTSTHALIGLAKELKAKEVEPYLVEVHLPVLDYFRKTGLLAILGEDHVFPTVEMAVQHLMPSGQGLPRSVQVGPT